MLNVLTTNEAQAIASLRPILAGVADRIGREAWKLDGPTALNAGRLVQTLEDGADAMFEALNVASAYLHCEHAEAAIAASRRAALRPNDQHSVKA